MKDRQEFFAAKGSNFTDRDAAIIGPIIAGMGNRKRGLTPEDIVETASDPENGLHPYFEWDDTRAAKEHRKQQARVMVCAIKIKVVGGSGEQHKTRAFQNVLVQSVDDEGCPTAERLYVPLEIIREEPDLAFQLLREATRQIVAWRDRWATYKDVYEAFLPIFEEVEKIERRATLAELAAEAQELGMGY